jgi:hypothetical protein
MPDIGAYFSFVVNMFRLWHYLRGADRDCVKVELSALPSLRSSFVIVGVRDRRGGDASDVLSQLLLAVPLCVLYDRHHRRDDDAFHRAAESDLRRRRWP